MGGKFIMWSNLHFIRRLLISVFPRRFKMVPPDVPKWYQGLFISLLTILSKKVLQVRTVRILFNSETGFILLTIIGEYEPAGAARLLLTWYRIGSITKKRQETNPDAVKTTIGTMECFIRPAKET
jgi:hypothetical protein